MQQLNLKRTLSLAIGLLGIHPLAIAAPVEGEGPVKGADSSLRAKVIAAARTLAEQANYTWTLSGESVPVEPVGRLPRARLAPERKRGKTTKEGFTLVSWPGRPGVAGPPGPLGLGMPAVEAVIKDNKVAYKHEGSGTWQCFAEQGQTERSLRVIGPGLRFLRFKTPATRAVDLAAKARSLTEVNGVISAELIEEDAQQVLPPSVQANRPTPIDGSVPKVSVEFFQPDLSGKVLVKFWVKDGALTKYQYRYQAIMRFLRERRAFNRTVTIEISNVGTTEVSVPEEAIKKLSSND
ncbi:MAG: hypothetical protein HY735_09950 [Verrucomicrobia bacterium]|nr:hypothetical protein [Verrucomicrobiota bacterium]